MAAYQDKRHSVGLAMVMELFVPGLGCIYGDHWRGAWITWGLVLGGGMLMLSGYDTGPTPGSSNDGARARLATGFGIMMAGAIYGFVDAIRSNLEYNQRLRQQLGLPEWIAFSLQPISTRQGIALAPSLHFTF